MSRDRKDWKERQKVRNTKQNEDGTNVVDENGDAVYHNPFKEGGRYTLQNLGQGQVTGTYKGVNEEGKHVFHYGGDDGYDQTISDDEFGDNTWNAYDYDPNYDDADDGWWDYEGNRDINSVRNATDKRVKAEMEGGAPQSAPSAESASSAINAPADGTSVVQQQSFYEPNAPKAETMPQSNTTQTVVSTTPKVSPTINASVEATTKETATQEDSIPSYKPQDTPSGDDLEIKEGNEVQSVSQANVPHKPQPTPRTEDMVVQQTRPVQQTQAVQQQPAPVQTVQQTQQQTQQTQQPQQQVQQNRSEVKPIRVGMPKTAASATKITPEEFGDLFPDYNPKFKRSADGKKYYINDNGTVREVSYIGGALGNDIYIDEEGGIYKKARKHDKDGLEISNSGIDYYDPSLGDQIDVKTLKKGDTCIISGNDGNKKVSVVSANKKEIIVKDESGNTYKMDKGRSEGHVYQVPPKAVANTSPSRLASSTAQTNSVGVSADAQNTGVYDSVEDDDTEDDGEQTPVEYMRNLGLLEDGTDQYYSEYMEGAPEYLTPEEQERRLRAMQTKQFITDMGSIASAFANLYYTSKEAPSMEVPVAKAPDYQKYIDKWNGQRNNYRKYAAMGKEYAYKRQKQDIEDAYQQDLRAIKLAYQQEQINLAKARTTAAQENTAMAWQKVRDAEDAAQKRHQLAVDNLEFKRQEAERKARERSATLSETTRHHVAMENKSTSKGGGRGGSVKSYKGGNYDYDIPSSVDQSRMEKAVIKDMIERGVIDPNNYVKGVDGKPIISESSGKPIVDISKPRKTDAELVREMHQKWDKRAGDIVRQDYGGSKRGESKATPSPRKAQPSASTSPQKTQVYYTDGYGGRFATQAEADASAKKHEEEEKRKGGSSASASGGSKPKAAPKAQQTKKSGGKAKTTEDKVKELNKRGVKLKL